MALSSLRFLTLLLPTHQEVASRCTLAPSPAPEPCKLAPAAVAPLRSAHARSRPSALPRCQMPDAGGLPCPGCRTRRGVVGGVWGWGERRLMGLQARGLEHLGRQVAPVDLSSRRSVDLCGSEQIIEMGRKDWQWVKGKEGTRPSICLVRVGAAAAHARHPDSWSTRTVCSDKVGKKGLQRAGGRVFGIFF